MTRGVRGVAVYLPRASDGRRRVRAWDEDAFTLAAAAVERLVASAPQAAAGSTVHLLGAASGIPPGLLAGLLGPTVQVTAATVGPGSPLGDALARAVETSGPEMLVGVVADPSADLGAAVPPPGEGAYAVLVDETSPDRPSLLPSGYAPPASTELAELRARASDARAGAATGWVGDWSGDPRVGRTPPSPSPTPSLPPPPAVSEGAYVPPASYQASLASRWRFLAERCDACATITFPARGRCRQCGRSDQLSVEQLPREDLRVAALTWIGPGGQPTEFDDQVAATGGYGVALVELIGTVRATVALTDAGPQELHVGSRVDTTLRRLYALEGLWRYGRKAVPRPTAQG